MTPAGLRVVAVCVVGLGLGCKKHATPTPEPEREREREPEPEHEHDEDEAREDQERDRDHYWRAQITIVGQGGVKTTTDAFDCTSDGVSQRGECGPRLVKFKELSPALMRATPANGWRFDHWESSIREPDGTVSARKGRMPDGRLYLNGFGYADTGELETVKAIFVPGVEQP